MSGRGLRVASWIDRLNQRTGQAMWYLTLGMIGFGAYNAITRYLSRGARIDPETATGLQPVWLAVGNVALWMNSNVFIELQWYLFSVVFLLGAAYTLKANAHVRVDVVYSRLSERRQAWINLLGAGLFLIPFCALMLWTSIPMVIDSFARLEGSPDPGGLPRYPLLAVVPIAFVLLLLQGASQIIRDVAKLRAKT